MKHTIKRLITFLIACCILYTGAPMIFAAESDAAAPMYVARGSYANGTYTVKIYLEGILSAGGTFGMKYDTSILTYQNFEANVPVFEPNGFPTQNAEGYHTFTYLADDGSGSDLCQPAGLDGTVFGGALLATYTFSIKPEDYKRGLPVNAFQAQNWEQTVNGQAADTFGVQAEIWNSATECYQGYEKDPIPGQLSVDVGFRFIDVATANAFAMYVLVSTDNGSTYTLDIYLKGILSSGGVFGLKYTPEKLTLNTFKPNVPVIEPKGFETQNDSDNGYYTFTYISDDGTDNELNQPGGLDGLQEPNGYLLGTFTFAVQDGASIVPTQDFTLKNLAQTANGQRADAQILADMWTADADGPDMGYYHAFYQDAALGSTIVGMARGDGESTGVTVSGKFSSYDPKKTATVELLDGTEVKFSTTVSAETGKGRTEQTFGIPNVAPGTYTLRITKPTHLTFIKQTVTVSTSDLTVTGLDPSADSASPDVAKLICGDIDQDGYVKLTDRNLLTQSKYYKNAVSDFEGAELELAKLYDLDGDGYVKLNDLNIMMSSENFRKEVTPIP
jgi:hypothetical protein